MLPARAARNTDGWPINVCYGAFPLKRSKRARSGRPTDRTRSVKRGTESKRAPSALTRLRPLQCGRRHPRRVHPPGVSFASTTPLGAPAAGAAAPVCLAARVRAVGRLHSGGHRGQLAAGPTHPLPLTCAPPLPRTSGHRPRRRGGPALGGAPALPPRCPTLPPARLPAGGPPAAAPPPRCPYPAAAAAATARRGRRSPRQARHATWRQVGGGPASGVRSPRRRVAQTRDAAAWPGRQRRSPASPAGRGAVGTTAGRKK